MSTDQTTMPERALLQQGVDWVAKHWARVRLGHEGFMLDKIQRQSRIVEQLAKNAMTGDSQATDAWPGNDGGDAMGVNIGDHIHYHYADQETETPQQAETQQPTQSSWKTKAAIATALLAGGTGVGAMTQAWLQPPAQEFTDTDTVTVPAAVQIYGTDKEQ